MPLLLSQKASVHTSPAPSVTRMCGILFSTTPLMIRVPSLHSLNSTAPTLRLLFLPVWFTLLMWLVTPGWLPVLSPHIALLLLLPLPRLLPILRQQLGPVLRNGQCLPLLRPNLHSLSSLPLLPTLLNARLVHLLL